MRARTTMRSAQLQVILVAFWAVLCQAFATDPSPKIVIDSHFHYVVVGGDHVAESIGRYLAGQDTNKTVLVLKGNRCNDVLEPSEPSKLWLDVSYLFAESAHYLGYDYIDPFLHGSKPGIAFTNQTASFIPPLQQLYAVDPNLKMLIDARPHRIIYNKASSTALGVEVSVNYETQYIFAKEELIIAGRCLEDYKLISQVDILSPESLNNLLWEVPLEIALKSPIIAPIFNFKTTPTYNHTASNKQPYCLLATELFIETLSKSQSDKSTISNDGIQPNAKVNVIVKEEAPDRWIGFNPSVIYEESAKELNDPAAIYRVLADTIEECMKIGTSETFQKLGLTLQPHRKPDTATYSCPTPDQRDSGLCFVNYTLSSVYSRDEDPLSVSSLYDMHHLTEDFRLKASRKLRLLPFGLTSPFLEHWWKRIFSPRKMVREYTTRMGILNRDPMGQLNQPSMDTLLAKLKERLKVIESIPLRH